MTHCSIIRWKLLTALALGLVGCNLDPTPAAEPEVSAPPTNLELVRDQTRAGQANFKACHAAELLTTPGLAGRLEVKVRMVEGRATDLSFPVDEPDNAALRACIEAEVANWRFPPQLDETLTVRLDLVAPGAASAPEAGPGTP